MSVSIFGHIIEFSKNQILRSKPVGGGPADRIPVIIQYLRTLGVEHVIQIHMYRQIGVTTC